MGMKFPRSFYAMVKQTDTMLNESVLYAAPAQLYQSMWSIPMCNHLESRPIITMRYFHGVSVVSGGPTVTRLGNLPADRGWCWIMTNGYVRYCMSDPD
jgi:hypothetical protein